MNFQIVPMASEQDMDGKAFVHWKAWQEAYADLVDHAYLAGLTLEKCRQMARRWPDNMLLAKTGEGRTIGFAGCGKSGDPDLKDAGEVFAIYVLKEFYGRKAGCALMNAALEKLSAFPRIAVWVLKDNARAVRFYERFGFARDGAEKEITLGKPLTEIRLVYERRS